MTPIFCTLDLGNSRWKVRVWELEGERRIRARSDIQGGVRERLEALEGFLDSALPRARSPLRFAVSSVIDPRIEERVLERIAARGDCSPTDPGLENRCAEPERVGRDRLFAARGALELLRRSCIVMDAGTALTVDVAVHRQRARGIFLGGAIAPGPALLARALSEGAARLPQVEPVPGARALGTGTPEAIASGVVHGFRGAARELARRIAAEADLADAPVVLTGGARSFLLDPEPVFDPPPVVEEDLVHIGLLEAAFEASGTRSP